MNDKPAPSCFWKMCLFAALAALALKFAKPADAIAPAIFAIRYAVERGILAAREEKAAPAEE